MARKLRVSVNSPVRPSESGLLPSVYVTQYLWPRIIAAAVFLLLVLLTVLYLWLGDSDEVEDSRSNDAPLFADSPAASSSSEQSKPDMAPAAETASTIEPVPDPAQPSQTAAAEFPGSQGGMNDTLGLSSGSLASNLSDEVDAAANHGAAGVMSPEFDARQPRFRLSVNDEPAREGSPAAAVVSEPDSEKGPPPEHGVMKTFSPAVTRAMLTSEIVDSEPGETLPGVIRLTAGEVSSAHVFAQVEDLEGAALRIIWYRDNVNYATMPLTVQSAKAVLTARLGLLDSMAGLWRVELQDDDGQLLSSGSFTAGT